MSGVEQLLNTNRPYIASASCNEYLHLGQVNGQKQSAQAKPSACHFAMDFVSLGGFI